MDVPVTLRDGKATTVYAAGFSADAPTGNAPTTGPTTAPVAVANGGTLDLNNITIDLTQDPPLVSTIDNKTLLTHVSINPLFSNSILNKVIANPLLVGANKASGLADATIASCKNFPASKLALSHDPANKGTCTIRYSLTNLTVGSDGVGQAIGWMFTKVGGDETRQFADSFDANVRDATTTIAGGIVSQNVTFNSGKYAVGFQGNVDMSDNRMMPLMMKVPLADLLAAQMHNENVIKNAPKEVPIAMNGILTNSKSWQFDSQPLTQALVQFGAQRAAERGGDVINNLINKKLNKGSDNSANNPNNAATGTNNPNATGNNANATSQPAFNPNDPLGSFLNIGQQQLQHQLDKQQQKNQQQNQQQPQR
jgi:hypothetical protein